MLWHKDFDCITTTCTYDTTYCFKLLITLYLHVHNTQIQLHNCNWPQTCIVMSMFAECVVHVYVAEHYKYI